MTTHQLKGHIFDFMDSRLAKIAQFIGSVLIISAFILGAYKYAKQAEEFYSNSYSFQKAVKSELKNNQDQSKFLSVQFKTLMEKNNVMWWISDSTGATVEMSAATSRFLQWSESELMGTGWLNYVSRDQHQGIMNEYQNCIKYRRDFDYIYEIRKGDGKLVKLHAHAKKGGSKWFGYLDVVK